MKRFILFLPLAVMLLSVSCAKEDIPEEGDSFVFQAAIAGETRYPHTNYEATEFDIDNDSIDCIGVFVTKPTDGVLTVNDVYQNYFNIGYRYNGTLADGNRVWKPYMSGTNIKVPVLPTELNFYAYYPWVQLGQTPTILNCLDSESITFRILQDQAVSNMPRCNIMRAKVKGGTYYNNNSYKTVTFQFEHVLTLYEFRIWGADDPADPDNKWEDGDELRLDRVVVLGNKISTEGKFDIEGDDPNVRITTNHTSSNSSIYKADTPVTGSALPLTVDGVTGATKPGGKTYMRRTVIAPPLVVDPASTTPEVGERADLEFLIEMRWRPAGEVNWKSTNRRYIVKRGTFKSGHKYLFEMKVTKHPLPQYDIVVTGKSTTWNGGYYPIEYEFD